MNKITLIIKTFLGFGSGHERTKKAQKNIVFSFVLKGLSIALGLISMPLTIHYLEPEKYGIYITLSSLIAWFSFFDIGFGGGLRNRFAEALAQGKHELARTYVSTTYAILSLIVGALMTVFLISNYFVNWNTILNVKQEVVSGTELKLLAIITFTAFSASLVLRLITTILNADQRPALASIFDLIGKTLSVILILMLIEVSQGSLIYFTISQSFTSTFVLLLSSFWFFRGKYKKYRPSLKSIEFSKARDLLSLGVKFFILNIAAILLYQTNNLIISQLFGPSQVAGYSVAFAYYGVLTMGFAIIVSPFWSAFTEAWVKKEIIWIKNIMRKLNLIWFILALFGVIMVGSSKFIFEIWIGNKVVVPLMMSILVCLWMIMNAFNSIYSHFLNGVGKVKLQMYLGISSAILNVPLAIYLGNKIGIEGIILANVLITLPGFIIYPNQYKRVISERATGLWNK